jgi:hypothetical protein
VLRLQLLYGGLVGVDLRLKRGLLEEVEEVAPLDLGALDKEPLSRNAVTRATSATRPTAWMRPMNSSV